MFSAPGKVLSVEILDDLFRVRNLPRGVQKKNWALRMQEIFTPPHGGLTPKQLSDGRLEYQLYCDEHQNNALGMHVCVQLTV